MSATATCAGSENSPESWHLYQLPTVGTALLAWLIQLQEKLDYLGENCMTLPFPLLPFFVVVKYFESVMVVSS